MLQTKRLLYHKVGLKGRQGCVKRINVVTVSSKSSSVVVAGWGREAALGIVPQENVAIWTNGWTVNGVVKAFT